MIRTFLIASALSLALSAPAAAQEPRATVERLVVAMNAGDAAAARALFAPDGGSAYGETAPLKTGPALDAWLASDIFGLNARFEVESMTGEGDAVEATGRWGNPPTRPFRYAFTVAGDRIQSWRVLRP